MEGANPCTGKEEKAVKKKGSQEEGTRADGVGSRSLIRRGFLQLGSCVTNSLQELVLTTRLETVVKGHC